MILSRFLSRCKMAFKQLEFLSPKAKGFNFDVTTPKELEDIWKNSDDVSLEHVCIALDKVDLDKYIYVIKDILLGFSIQIYGLPKCEEKDLLLAVYIMIEDKLGISPGIEMWKKLDEDNQVVGVVFNTRELKNKVILEAHRLIGTGIRINSNLNFMWILDYFESEL